MGQISRPGLAGRGATNDDDPDYNNPKEFIIGRTTITGTEYLDTAVLVVISKLTPGLRIMVPGEATSNAVKNMWEQGLFDDVKLNISDIRNDTIYFDIAVVERPRLTRIELSGVPKGQESEVMKKLSGNTGKVVNENLLTTTTNTIKKYFLHTA